MSRCILKSHTDQTVSKTTLKDLLLKEMLVKLCFENNDISGNH